MNSYKHLNNIKNVIKNYYNVPESEWEDFEFKLIKNNHKLYSSILDDIPEDQEFDKKIVIDYLINNKIIL